MLQLAGAEADGVIINWLSAGDVPQVVAEARKGAEHAGRDPGKLEVVCRISVCMSQDEAFVDFLGRRSVAAYLNVPVYAQFHEWLGRGVALAPMWQAWHRRREARAAATRAVIGDLLVRAAPRSCAVGPTWMPASPCRCELPPGPDPCSAPRNRSDAARLAPR
jgi:alkanesulfonate monooxygenase SsuD/methylene tetrahydromethanopterin reductase-like flavin-dependent oxidoreductase (luciferase family)